MRIRKHFAMAASALALLPLASCVDDNYDLSNIDSTSRIPVNDLVLPINIEPIKLGDVMKIDEGSKIQSVNIGGQEFYALVQSGEFSSDPISIAAVKATPSPINPWVGELSDITNAPASGPRRMPTLSYEMNHIGNSFSYDAADIDEAIVELGYIKTKPFKLAMTLEVLERALEIDRLAFRDLDILVPAGLTAEPTVGTYDSESGLWHIGYLEITDRLTTVELEATGVDMKKAGAYIDSDRSLVFNSQFLVQKGYVELQSYTIVDPSSFSVGDMLKFQILFDLSEFEVETFTGKIKYDIEGISIDPVTLTDIPEFLDGDDTNIEIANPQIYLQLNNPVADVALQNGGRGLQVTSGLHISAMRDGLPTLDFNSATMTLTANHGVAGPYNYVFSPDKDANNVPEEFASNLTPVDFPSLGSLLATPADWTTHGLPDELGIELESPAIAPTGVKDFPIPHDFQKVEGKWEMLAPLALNDGSKILYTDIRDGWYDDSLEDLTVTTLEVTADADNECPVALELYVVAVDINGNDVAKASTNRLEPGADQTLTFTMTGEITNLDGIRIYATLEGTPDNKPLSPEETLNLTNIRVKVGGYYQKKF